MLHRIENFAFDRQINAWCGHRVWRHIGEGEIEIVKKISSKSFIGHISKHENLPPYSAKVQIKQAKTLAVCFDV